MAVATVSSSTPLGGKALLEKADRHFRLCQFDVAFKTCDEAIKSSEFTANWKDKKRHEVIKTYIVYGRQSGKSQSVLKWLMDNKDQLGDYPLYICEWVHVELGDKDPKRLRVGSHEAMKKSEEQLTAIISERKAEGDSASKERTSVISMCLHTLVNKVLIPNGQAAKAEQMVKDCSSHLSKDAKDDLARCIEKALATPRVASRPNTTSCAAGLAAAAGAAPQVDSNSVVGQIVRTWSTFVDKFMGGNQTLAVSAVFVVGWWGIRLLGSRGTPQPPSIAPQLDTVDAL